MQIDIRQTDTNAAPIVLNQSADVPYVSDIMTTGECFRSKGSLQFPVPTTDVSYSISVIDLKSSFSDTS